MPRVEQSGSEKPLLEHSFQLRDLGSNVRPLFNSGDIHFLVTPQPLLFNLCVKPSLADNFVPGASRRYIIILYIGATGQRKVTSQVLRRDPNENPDGMTFTSEKTMFLYNPTWFSGSMMFHLGLFSGVLHDMRELFLHHSSRSKMHLEGQVACTRWCGLLIASPLPGDCFCVSLTGQIPRHGE